MVLLQRQKKKDMERKINSIKYIGVDVGTQNVGIAVSQDGLFASPKETILYKNTIDYIKELILEGGTVVIGDSKNLKQEENEVSFYINKIKSALEDLDIKVVLAEEQFSTQAAYRLAKEKDRIISDGGRRRITKSAMDKDSHAASYYSSRIFR